MNRLLSISFLTILLSVTAFAGGHGLGELIEKLEKLPVEKRLKYIEKYSEDDQEFREHYTLNADIRILGLKIGKMELGEVTISNRDSFSISYNPPFEKWDTRYLSHWQGDSVFVDEVISAEPEKFIYKKISDCWRLSGYLAKSPRKTKQSIYDEGLSTDALNLIEVIRLLYQQKYEKIHKVLFLAENYPIRLKKITSELTDYTIYSLKWNISQGEERVRLHGIYLVGMETDEHFIPLGGILKVSFVGLVDVKLIGVINQRPAAPN